MVLKQKNVLSLLEDKTNAFNDRVALGMKTAMGWKEFTYKGLGLLSRKLAWHLINELQVKKGTDLQYYPNQNLSTEHVYLPQYLPV